MNAAGTGSTLYFRHASIMPGGLKGLSANFAPKAATRGTSAASWTVPTPTQQKSPTRATSVESTRSNSTLSSVTSSAEQPRFASSTPRAMAASAFLARRIATTLPRATVASAPSRAALDAGAAAAAVGGGGGGAAPAPSEGQGTSRGLVGSPA